MSWCEARRVRRVEDCASSDASKIELQEKVGDFDAVTELAGWSWLGQEKGWAGFFWSVTMGMEKNEGDLGCVKVGGRVVSR